MIAGCGVLMPTALVFIISVHKKYWGKGGKLRRKGMRNISVTFPVSKGEHKRKGRGGGIEIPPRGFRGYNLPPSSTRPFSLIAAISN